MRHWLGRGFSAFQVGGMRKSDMYFRTHIRLISIHSLRFASPSPSTPCFNCFTSCPLSSPVLFLSSSSKIRTYPLSCLLRSTHKKPSIPQPHRFISNYLQNAGRDNPAMFGVRPVWLRLISVTRKTENRPFQDCLFCDG